MVWLVSSYQGKIKAYLIMHGKSVGFFFCCVITNIDIYIKAALATNYLMNALIMIIAEKAWLLR